LPRQVFSPRLLRYRALIVPVKPMWSSAISPSDHPLMREPLRFEANHLAATCSPLSTSPQRPVH
jgi:hypothetical protein